jgi:uroporphyrinogen decarboxylase
MKDTLRECIVGEKTSYIPIWFMRQAGRYLPEFREIRKKNPDFIKLCLNTNLTPEITLQPLKRFELDAAIIFSDILMLPYGLGQKVEFKKNFGPILGKINFKKIQTVGDKEFSKKLEPVYESINITSKDKILNKKDLIGFVGAPWTIYVYMQNRQSPNKFKSQIDRPHNFFFKKTFKEREQLISIIIKYLKLHIKNQVDSGATIIQIFDSWAELIKEDSSREEVIYSPTKELVDYTKQLGVPVICFPRGIKTYKKFCEIVKPDAINIDYEVDPKTIVKEIKIPVQGGLYPKILLGDKDQLKKAATKYLEIFKDHPYIFNLGHGVLPETDPNTVDYLIKFVKDFK